MDEMSAIPPKCRFIREEVYSWTPDELADEIERLSGIALERGEALERAKGCIRGLLARTPVRDVAETLAEIDNALRGPEGEGFGK